MVGDVAASEGWPTIPDGMNVVWEIPETQSAVRELLRPGALGRFTASGAEIALDDLGAGWQTSTAWPEYNPTAGSRSTARSSLRSQALG